MSSDLWANVASGAVGGVLALGGHWLVHFLTTKAEDKKRKIEWDAKHIAELKALYIDFMNNVNDRDRKTAAFAQQSNLAADQVPHQRRPPPREQ